MKVDIVNQSSPSGGLKVVKNNRKPSFTGSTAIARQITGEITTSLPQAGAINMMKKLEWLKGEIGGILITAIGTGTVAPIFIAFNPFARAPKNASKEEKQKNTETKEYTAMRQPVSAALAILFQASVQKYIDKFLDKLVNNPENAKYVRIDMDQSKLNTDTYIKRKVREQFKNDHVEKPSLFKHLFGDKVEYQGAMVRPRAKYNAMFNTAVDQMKDDQIENLAKTFQETGEIPVAEGHVLKHKSLWQSIKEALHITKKETLQTTNHVENKTIAELINKQIDDYIKDAQDLKKSPEEIAVKVQRAKVLIENEDYLKNLFKDIPAVDTETKNYSLEEIRAKAPETTKAVQSALEKVENDGTLGETRKAQIKQLLQEILDRPEDLRAHRIDRTLWRIGNIKEMCGPEGFTPEKYMDAMIERNNVLEKIIVKLQAARISDAAHATKDTVVNTIKKVSNLCTFKEGSGIIESVLKDTDTFNYDGEKLLKKVYKDITKGYKKVIDKSYKSWNQFVKIGVGVFITLPITCTALNWVYPRFMEIFFPKLAGVKKTPQTQKTGGDK